MKGERIVKTVAGNSVNAREFSQRMDKKAPAGDGEFGDIQGYAAHTPSHERRKAEEDVTELKCKARQTEKNWRDNLLTDPGIKRT
jgi:hypothetical protein